MSSITLRVQYRPLRIGFCVQEGNKKALIQAAQYNTAIWGGIYNPIIPISATKKDVTKNAHRLVEQFDVDVLFPITKNKTIQSFIASYPELEWYKHFPGQFIKKDAKKEEINVLDVIHALEDLYDKYAVVPEGESNFYAVTWKETDPENIANILSYGQYPKLLGRKKLYENAFNKALKANPVTVKYNEDKPKNLFSVFHRTDLTDVDLTHESSELGGVRFGVFLGSQTSFQDLINFWNIRATGKHIRFIPVENLATYAPILKEIEPHFDNYPYGVWVPDGNDIDTLRQQLTDIGINSRNYVVTATYPRVLYPSIGGRSGYVHAIEHSVLADDDISGDHNTVSFTMPELPFKNLKQYSTQQLVIDVVNQLVTYTREDHLLQLPTIRAMNKWYGRALSLDLDRFRIHRSRLSFIINDTKHIFRLYPVKRTELFKEIFKNAGFETRRNSPNTLANKINEQMGRLQSTRVFKITGVRKVLELPSYKPVSEEELRNIIRDYDPATRSVTFDRFKDLIIAKRTNSKDLTISDTVDYLLRKKVIQPGFTPVCPNCELKPWVSLEAANDHVICEYCGKSFQLALSMNRQRSFHYRKSGLFSPNNHQEGVITTLIALQTLDLALEPFEYTHSFALDIKENGKHITDIDFTLLELKQQRDVMNSAVSNAIAIAECKTNKEITYSEMKKLADIKSKLDASGLRAKLLFAKLTDFTPTEIANIKRLGLAKDEIIMLSDKELEAENLGMYYHDYKTKKLPSQYAHSLDDVAQNSHAIYLS